MLSARAIGLPLAQAQPINFNPSILNAVLRFAVLFARPCSTFVMHTGRFAHIVNIHKVSS